MKFKQEGTKWALMIKAQLITLILTTLSAFPKSKCMKLISQQMLRCETCWYSRKIEQMKATVKKSVLCTKNTILGFTPQHSCSLVQNSNFEFEPSLVNLCTTPDY